MPLEDLLAEITAAGAAEGAAAGGVPGDLLVPRVAEPADLAPTLPTVDAASTLCQICSKNFYKYTCPQCQMRYCCLACYKNEAHPMTNVAAVLQADCSEGFYKAEFMEALKSKVVNPKEREQMASVLREFEASQAAEGPVEGEDGEPVPDLLERLRGLDLDDESQTEQVLAALTETERAQFADRRYLASLLVQWNPWWSDDDSTVGSSGPRNTAQGPPLVEVIGAGSGALEGSSGGRAEEGGEGDEDEGELSPKVGAARRERAEPPPLAEHVVPLGELLRGKQPARELIFNVLDLLYSYAYICRRYNGDVDQPWTECAEGLLAISPVLGADAAHTSVEMALHASIARGQEVEAMFVSAWASAQVIADVASIARDRVSVARALAHLSRIMSAAVGSKAPVVMPKAKEARQRLKRADKKLKFFVSWWTWLSGEEGDDGHVATRLLAAIGQEIQATHRRRVDELAAVDAEKAVYERAWNGPTPPKARSLIEEL